ncbi:hypothetical protein C8R47DRAFT_1166120 [Mycena vitilis]|nr:hypothetical protein C8R47DRAFT_1166120 [Mycena vitilis]
MRRGRACPWPVGSVLFFWAAFLRRTARGHRHPLRRRRLAVAQNPRPPQSRRCPPRMGLVVLCLCPCRTWLTLAEAPDLRPCCPHYSPERCRVRPSDGRYRQSGAQTRSTQSWPAFGAATAATEHSSSLRLRRHEVAGCRVVQSGP